MRRHEVTGPVIVSLLAFTVVILTGGGYGQGPIGTPNDAD